MGRWILSFHPGLYISGVVFGMDTVVDLTYAKNFLSEEDANNDLNILKSHGHTLLPNVQPLEEAKREYEAMLILNL